jgi:hypothetical protein
MEEENKNTRKWAKNRNCIKSELQKTGIAEDP